MHLLKVCLLTVSLLLLRCDAKPHSGAERELVIFAAASLRDVFSQLGKSFESRHTGTKLSFNFAGTQELRSQIELGARPDVFASADRKHMSELDVAGRVEAPLIFAHNEPVMIVSKESAAQLRSLADLPSAQRVVVGAREVPIGRYTGEILERANRVWGTDFSTRVEARVASRELNVRQVLSKVSLGEAQAGIVYRSDAQAAGASVVIVAIPQELNVVAEYPVAVLRGTERPELARAFVSYLLGAEAQQAFERAGFRAARGASSP